MIGVTGEGARLVRIVDDEDERVAGMEEIVCFDATWTDL